jgi:hypothetical protein
VRGIREYQEQSQIAGCGELIELFLNRALVALELNISRSFCSNLEHLQMLRDLLSVNSRHFSLYPVWQCNCKFRWVPGGGEF